ncbi:hypothetical protein QBC40DRAFT_188468 [Triangularia verruculosa]|uniref:Uncharacterized protein n=1 Tax=Triangularia verruculosa TaxID=2587418 RepID=A0AAN6X787_9PEZI|nr:hypothetical protein QBC40DRAFT_188468 [Triangularia verruculosa]
MQLTTDFRGLQLVAEPPLQHYSPPFWSSFLDQTQTSYQQHMPNYTYQLLSAPSPPYMYLMPSREASGLPTNAQFSNTPVMGGPSLGKFPVPLTRHPDTSGQARAVLSPRIPQCWEHGCNGRSFSTFSNRHQREKSGQTTKATCPKCSREFTRSTARNEHTAWEGLNIPRRKTTNRTRANQRVAPTAKTG